MTDPQIRALYEDGSYDFVPHDGMRRTIAQRLTAAAQSMPVFYLTLDCDIGRLMAAREEINAAAPKTQDGKPAYKLSVNDFVIKALALALQRNPETNVTWTEAGMLHHKHSDIGVAVALPFGLITPIIRNAEAKSLSAISNEMRDFAARARAKKLKPHEYQGGTSSVSNLGMYGIKDFTAVINPPQSTHPRRRDGRGAAGGAGRQARDRHADERDAGLRSPRHRRRARRRTDRRLQAAHREPGDDGGVSRERSAPMRLARPVSALAMASASFVLAAPARAELPPQYTIWTDFAAVTAERSIPHTLGVVDSIARTPNGKYLVRGGACVVEVTVVRASAVAPDGKVIVGPSHVERVEVGAKRCDR